MKRFIRVYGSGSGSVRHPGLHCQLLCHVLKALIFIKIALKLSYFAKLRKIFQALGAPPPVSRAYGGYTIKQSLPSTANFWLRAWQQYLLFGIPSGDFQRKYFFSGCGFSTRPLASD